MSIGDQRERRRHFRLRFPTRERPILDSSHGRLTVVEMSEQGLRVASPCVGGSGDLVTGTLLMADGFALDVQSRVYRVEGAITILCDLHGVTMADMLREQRRLMKKYAATDFLMPPRSA